MEDDVYHLLDELDHRGPARTHSQYPMLQPQFRPLPQPVSARDRYRAPRHHNEPVYDRVSDDELYEEESPFDSFDEELLQQPYVDRKTQADQGRARLSFTPKGSNTYTTGAGFQPQSAFHGGYSEMHNVGAQFAYNTIQSPEFSSDARPGLSSSPAFKASQRQADNPQLFTPDRPTMPQIYAEGPRATGIAQNRGTSTSRPHVPLRLTSKRHDLHHAPPIIQGIPLVSTMELPDRLQTIFPFPTFNAVQSKCFEKVYKSDNNFVLASPTGSGKTAILELAICRAINTNTTNQYKIIYQAPTKALCSERQRDWLNKFTPLGLSCVELTGDSDNSDLRNVQTANIIITTPEKWDLITRKWRDHEKLMKLVRLFLIDEVHILNEDRGATLETIVSRMKTIGTDVRFVALSATVPNFDDVATWLGKNAAEPHEAAGKENFGEEFRPVKLRKTVCGYSNGGNDWMFEKFLDSKLPEVISKYSERKPIMIFCCTRKATQTTAKVLTDWWISRSSRDRYWKAPPQPPQFQDRELRECVASGVAFHHAGLDLNDRLGVEKGFLEGDLNVICCTSTLAVGINLPCHFVIIKNTVTFGNGGLREYADLEIMQMLGRAGRPQFDDSAIAVIMTRHTKVRRYEMMVTGQELLESRLHLNLIDHLNAEIGLGTIRDLSSAREWIAGTFLHVRLKKNPSYYKLKGAKSGQGMDEQLDDICVRDITLLQDNDLVTSDEQFRCTHFGDAMTRHYVHFETMKTFINLRPKAQISEILSAIAQASEFEQIRFRAGEKNFYKNLNRSSAIRFAIPVNLASPAHKVSLMIQSVLGNANLTWDDEMQKHRSQYNMEITMIFKQASRLIRCIIDCQISLRDAVSINHALMLDRSLGARAWDDSPMQMKQIEDVGVVSIMKFISAGIRSIEDLECTEAHRIEAIMNRNPPFGMKILGRLKLFPKLRVSVHVQSSSITKTPDGVNVQVKVDVGFMNEKPPQRFNGKPVYVCVLAETSDGRMVHFARISGQKLDQGQDLIFPALLTGVDQFINCYAMCDEIAGTQREATIKPKIAPSMFSAPKLPEVITPLHRLQRPTPNMSKRRTENNDGGRKRSGGSDEFDDDGIDDDELVQAALGEVVFDHIENYANPTDALTRKNTNENASTKGKRGLKPVERRSEDDDHEARQLDNGKWACNHKCKDKNKCKHLCCRNGLENPPKKPMKRSDPTNKDPSHVGAKNTAEKERRTQTKLQLTVSKRKSSTIEEMDLTQQEKRKKIEYAISGPSDYRHLHLLHENVQKKDPPASISSIMHKKPAYHYAIGGGHNLSFMEEEAEKLRPVSSDYGDLEPDVFSTFDHSESSRAQMKHNNREHGINTGIDLVREVISSHSDAFGDDDSILGDVMVGLADSQNLQAANEDDDQGIAGTKELFSDMDYETNVREDEFPVQVGIEDPKAESPTLPNQMPSSSIVEVPVMPSEKRRSLFFGGTRSSTVGLNDCKTTKDLLGGLVLEEMKQAKEKLPKSRIPSREKAVDLEYNLEFDENDLKDLLESPDMDKTEARDVSVPDGFEDLEPWLLAEFGDIVELVD
ncbi:ATP-dependent DNA helicase MER3 [Melanomma pulvis-pyrius CBS 109.77]|uniref:DNA 3'-5' helicase n=1 Tax=Melanomma pulvis-pyrius CBS 109.77 TaxID=1314802 RepID=A0A6A6WRL7_9PLEO|nr:ATP-dependent DNA helicase MER3 [Melanomma pulvis-pyrius CBS 109.77]